MLGRAGSWIGSAIAGATTARYWFYQDFAAGSGPAITITGNDNGGGGGFVFDSSRIIDGSAVATDTDGNPIYDAAAEDPTDLVDVTAHTGTSVTLSAAPDAGQGTLRIWYLYAIQGGTVGPLNIEVAPRFVQEVRSQHLDTRYLNAGLNLSDLTSASLARTNLGFSNQTAGAVLIGDGGTTFTSDPTELFWDNTNNRLGVGTNTPAVKLDVVGAANVSTILTTPQIYGSSASGGDLAINSTSHATKGDITLGDMVRVDEANLRLYVSKSTSNFALSTAVTSIVDSAGNVQLALIDNQSAATGPYLVLQKQRGGAGGTSDAATNDVAGNIEFRVSRNTGTVDSIASIVATYTGSGTTRRGTLTLSTANDAAPTARITMTYDGIITIGNSYREYASSKVRYGDYTTGGEPVATVFLGFKTTAANPYMSFEDNNGQRWIMHPGPSSLQFNRQANDLVGFGLDTSSRFQVGDATPTYNMGVSRGGGDTGTDPAAPNSTTANLIGMRQISATANNFGGIVGLSQGGFLSGGMVFIHEGHANGSSGRVEFLTRNSGTYAIRAVIRSDGELRLNGTTSGYFGQKAAATTTSYTVTWPSAVAAAANSPLLSDASGNLSWGTSPIASFKAGSSTISNGARTKAITFGTTFGSTNYQVLCTIRNTAQLTPQYLSWTLISQTATGFTIEINEATDSANYELCWAIIGNYDP